MSNTSIITSAKYDKDKYKKSGTYSVSEVFNGFDLDTQMSEVTNVDWNLMVMMALTKFNDYQYEFGYSLDDLVLNKENMFKFLASRNIKICDVENNEALALFEETRKYLSHLTGPALCNQYETRVDDYIYYIKDYKVQNHLIHTFNMETNTEKLNKYYTENDIYFLSLCNIWVYRNNLEKVVSMNRHTFTNYSRKTGLEYVPDMYGTTSEDKYEYKLYMVLNKTRFNEDNYYMQVIALLADYYTSEYSSDIEKIRIYNAFSIGRRFKRKSDITEGEVIAWVNGEMDKEEKEIFLNSVLYTVNKYDTLYCEDICRYLKWQTNMKDYLKERFNVQTEDEVFSVLDIGHAIRKAMSSKLDVSIWDKYKDKSIHLYEVLILLDFAQSEYCSVEDGLLITSEITNCYDYSYGFNSVSIESYRMKKRKKQERAGE